MYAVDKISGKDLSACVFVNMDARVELLQIIKVKTKKKFDKLCQENGWEKKYRKR